MVLSKVTFWTLYSARAKIEEIRTCYNINLASFIGIDELIRKIWITD